MYMLLIKLSENSLVEVVFGELFCHCCIQMTFVAFMIIVSVRS